MKDIAFYFNGITFNIIAYMIMSFATTLRLGRITNDLTEKVLNLMMMFWFVFFTGYLITNYNYILKSPINNTLNNYETITNFIIGSYIIHRYVVDKKRNPDKYHE